MKFAYKFSNLLGTVFRKGNLVFSKDGNSIISPVGNRLTVYDLKNNKSQTLSIQSNYNITSLDLSPNGCLLVASNESGETFMISMISQTVIHTYKFNCEPKCIKFSPDGKFFAMCVAELVYIFKSPGMITGQFNSFIIERIFHDAHEEKTCLDWSFDSRFIIVGSKDNSAKIFALRLLENFRPFVLSGHSDEIVSCAFEENSLNAFLISRNGQLSMWESSMKAEDFIELVYVKTEEPEDKRQKEEDSDEDDDFDNEDEVEKSSGDENNSRDKQGKIIVANDEEKQKFFYKRLARHYLMDELKKENRNVKLTSASYHKKLKLLVTAYSTGAFYLHELPDVTMIHSLNISDYAVDTAIFNTNGDWVALGVSGAGQLLVWEWQSEQYVMKQQGHSNVMSSISYSPDGNFIVTGSYDGKVKVWNVQSGFCFMTFSEHTSGVTGIDFCKNKKFFASASLDGTVRAFDMIRYRNFKTFTAPRLVQFSCVAIDYSGELVAAGAQDVFDIHLWSLKFGKILEVLSGHEAPVASLDFSPVPTSSALVSGSWDHTIKIWNCLETSGSHETVDLSSDVVCVAFNPNGEEVAVASLNCTISIFNVVSAEQINTIECKRDVGFSISDGDVVSAKKSMETKYFSSITYSADGECILAGGKSKFVCIYHVREGILLKKFEITQNMSLDGMTEFINRRNLTDFGNLALIEERDKLEGGNIKLKLPGAQKNDVASRNFKPEVGVSSLMFSPNGQQWAAASTEGLMIYSLDKGIVFDPFQMSIEVTPKAARSFIEDREYSSALIMSLKLNEDNLIQEIIEKIPHKEIELVLDSLPPAFIPRIVDFLSKMLNTQHLEFYLKWTCSALTKFGQKNEILDPQILVSLHQNLNRKYEALNKICDYNKYTIRVIRKTSKLMPTNNDEDDAMLLVSKAPNEENSDVSMDDDTSEE
ncbi:CLUMA_CG016395, isoform A [Clunio marinus]|uniref:CLUMA_CG016395, isoform A n=1 Tax=Clunio marinus TaxID=568069 RepID=A0A1J1IUP2_9DIPT|nr:CLUMA_CG016395, isoform A [Clunio marinus]